MALPLGILGIIIALLLAVGWFFFSLLRSKIQLLERRIIKNFISRSDCFPALYEVTQPYINKHGEVFREIMALRKKEFHIIEHKLDL